MGILRQLSAFSAKWEKPQVALSRFMRLDNGSLLGALLPTRCGGLSVGSGFRSHVGPEISNCSGVQIETGD